MQCAFLLIYYRNRHAAHLIKDHGLPWAAQSPMVQWAPYTMTALVQYMCIYHGRGNILVAEQFLRGANIVAIFDQVGCKRIR